jgi:hypothetical protein
METLDYPNLELKTVGRSGQISLGKALSGKHFFVENLPSGDVLLKHAMIVPMNEQWLHASEVRQQLAQADAWMADNAPLATPLDVLASQLNKVGVTL